MKWSFREKAITAILVVVLVLLGLVSFISDKNTTELIESYNQVQKTYQLLNTVTNFFAAMTVAESGRRGYIFSGSKVELDRYANGRLEMRFKLSDLEELSKDDLQLKRLAAQLNNLANQRLNILQRSIALYKQNQNAFHRQSLLTKDSVAIREKIQNILNHLKNQEEKKLNKFVDDARQRIDVRTLIQQIIIILIFILVIIACFIFSQERLNKQKLIMLEKALESEREVNELKHRLFSMISHEFRTPLSIIIASSQLLGEILEPAIAEKELKNLYRIQTSAKLINHLLTDILTLTRAESGNLEFNPQILNLEEFCLNLLEDLQSLNITKPNFNFTSIGRINKVILDEKIIYCIISNLLLNAIKYSPTNSQIDLMIKVEFNQVIFIIKDQGRGIAIEEQDKIFEPFLRGKNVDNIPGTGLGLAVVKKCLEIHQGTITLESDLGKGTKFTVVIPQHFFEYRQ